MGTILFKMLADPIQIFLNRFIFHKISIQQTRVKLKKFFQIFFQPGRHMLSDNSNNLCKIVGNNQFEQNKMDQKYKTLRVLGEGSFGTVFLVQGSAGQLYALKNIQINPFTREESKQEVQALKILEHENFIKIYDFFESEDTLQILTEFCDGSTLQSFCKENGGKIQANEIKLLINQIVEAAIYMNDKGVIHRDLKPENILLFSQKGKHIIKICDLGCAKRSIISDISLEVQSSFEKGTTLYTSPEQLQSESYSKKCDVWSMGCLLHQLIFGVHPYRTNDIEEMKELMKTSSENSILRLPKETDPYLKMVLKISLKYKDQERATWKQIKLLRLFLERSQDINSFIVYLKELGEIGEWIFEEIWEGRKQLQITKDMKRAYVYFITGFLSELYKMVIEIVKKESQFQHFFHNKQITEDQGLIREVKDKFEKYKSVNQKIKEHLEKSEGLKRLLRKIPATRNATLPHLQYTIKYGKKIIEQIFSSKNPSGIFSHSKILYVLALWFKFEENFIPNMSLQASEIRKQDAISNNNIAWIKNYLNLA